ncbi:MAG TPA: SCO family protein, partial [Verrucomicrobiae bacterium]|nr:SCO family protein [Verrucomicrobiae bacterium]
MKTIILLVIAIMLAQIARVFADQTNSPCPLCCRRQLAPAVFTDKSLYQVNSKWTTDRGKEINFADLSGKPQVILMFFSHCVTACPILVYNLKHIESALPPAKCSRIGFTLVSFDSEHDTPTVLAQYRKAMNLDSNWTLLNGKPEDVLELAALLGVQYKQNADGQFAHS